MRDLAGKHYWIVGASAGLGRAVSLRLSRLGARLTLSARSTSALQELAAQLPGPARVLPCDIAEAAEVQRAAQLLGEIDGVVFLAGLYWPMTAQNWQGDQATAMADVNLTGAMRVLGAVVPQMVARDAGHIVLTGSLAGYRGLPGSVGYGASKAGVMALAEGMYADLRGTGVDVQLINPGFIRTRLTDKNDFAMPFIMEPDRAAEKFVDHMLKDTFQTSFPTGFSLMFRLGQLLPDALYYRVF